MGSVRSRASGRDRSSFAHPAALAVVLSLLAVSAGFAQQRTIVNPNFIKRFSRGMNPMELPDYSASRSLPANFCFPLPPSSPLPATGCLRYLGDARCLPPSGTPVDDQGCMAGWITTDSYDGNDRDTFVQNGYIKAPTQVAIGTNVEGLSVPNGAAELNAENAGRLYQKVCLLGGETIPFQYSLGNPVSTSQSRARFGVFMDNETYPGMAAGPGSIAVSGTVTSQTMMPQMGTVTAPATGGVYQIGFEAILPASGANGNYIADVRITLKPLVDFKALPVQIMEGQSGFLDVRVNGTIPASGISVWLQLGTPTASSSDYTLDMPVAYGSGIVGSAALTPSGSGYLLFIPQGSYDGNALSDSNGQADPSGAVRIRISTTADTTIEDNETFSLTLEAPGTNGSSPGSEWERGTTACFSNSSQMATVTIVDNDVDLVVTKVVDNAAPVAGGNVIYTVTFSNNTARPTVEPMTAHDANAIVADAVPPGLTFTSWSCVASSGASCPAASGSGAISGNAVLPAGSGTVTFTINALVGAAQCGAVTNTATVNVPASLQEANSSDNTASIMIDPVCPASLAVSLTNNSTGYTPGSTGTYVITVTNSGLAAATNLSLTDSLPSGVTLTGVPGCTATGTATCGTISGSAGGSLFTATGASLETGAGHSLVYTLPVAFAPTMTANPLVNTVNATASSPTPPASGSDSDALSPFTVGISKSTSSTVAQPGGTVDYTVVVTNGGIVAAPNTTVSDSIPAGLTSFSWTCTAAGGAVCPNASGNGAINETLAVFPAGGSVQYQINAAVSMTPPATVTNLATASPPAGGVCSGGAVPPCDSSVDVPAGASVSVQKSTTTTLVIPNGPVSFAVTVTNSGSVAAPGTVLSDPVPAGIASQSWTCAASGGAVCPAASGSGALNETIATLPAGGALTYTIAAIATSAPPATVSNTATITPPSGGICVGSCLATVVISAAPVVSVTKTTTSIVAQPGGLVAYTLAVTNSGSVAAPNTTVVDPIPAGLTSFSWTCTAAGGAACPNASGSGAINETLAVFPTGGSVQYQISAAVSTTPPATVTNMATVSPLTGGVCSDASTPPCGSSVAVPAGASVSVQKSTTTTLVTPNGPVDFAVTVTNSGSVAAPNTVLSDPLPAGIASQSWTCAASGGAVCPAASGTGALNETIATLPSGSELTYTIAAVATAAPPATVSNTATITPPSGGTCVGSCSDTAVVSAAPVVSITKTTTATEYLPNSTIDYTIVLENPGSVAAPNTLLADPLPAGIASATWTCAASGGAACPAASGTGGINETVATLPAGSSMTFTLSAVVASLPPAAISNTATLTPPSGGTCIGSCSATVTTPAAAMIEVEAASTSVSAIPGQSVTLTFTVTNVGTGAADGTRINNPVPSGLTSFTWTCTATGGAVCPNASGTGPIAETVGTFPVGGSLTYVVTARVDASAPTTITNTVTTTPPTGGICSGSCTVTMLVLVTIVAQAIPSLSTIGLLVLAATLAAAAMLRLRH